MKSAVKARKVVSSGNGNWDESKEIGTLKSNLVKTDILSLSNKNIEGDASHVILFVKNEEDAVPVMLYCTKPLSKIVRKAVSAGKGHKDIIKALMGLKMANLDIENDEGDTVQQTFILAPGKQGESFTVEALAKGDAVSLEDLV